MSKEKTDEIYTNRAYLEKKEMIDHTDCEDCLEDLVFAMADKHHSFTIGMTTILECLSIAEQEAQVPKLPSDWWQSIYDRYH